jgi:hypothetical protein
VASIVSVVDQVVAVILPDAQIEAVTTTFDPETVAVIESKTTVGGTQFRTPPPHIRI